MRARGFAFCKNQPGEIPGISRRGGRARGEGSSGRAGDRYKPACLPACLPGRAPLYACNARISERSVVGKIAVVDKKRRGEVEKKNGEREEAE